MPNSSFSDLLINQIKKKKSYICIGLDPNFEGDKCIPKFVLENANNNYEEAIFQFNKTLIDNTCEFTPVYKPQSAFYEKYEAYNALKKTIEYIHKKGSLVILDAKRNDIGNTSKAYAHAIFKNMNVDSTTINGYLGTDCVQPFLNNKGKGLFILVKTSNKSSSDFQDSFTFNENIMRLLNSRISQKIGTIEQNNLAEVVHELIQKGTPTNGEICIRNYLLMARLVKKWSDEWKKTNETEYNYTDIGAVVGATFPEQMKIIRKEIPESLFLIPGYGAQGGKADDIVQGFNPDGFGAIINSSRGINYAYVKEQEGEKYKPEEFGKAAKIAANTMREDINNSMNKKNILPWK
ncbi:MAG: orotidine-5'-phosphate decarboxylase [archaeon]|nr:orotidine-5'-phosphate decarboxylase [archaeon]